MREFGEILGKYRILDVKSVGSKGLITKYEDKKQIYMLFLWKILTFITFCGNYYDICENQKMFISNASWEILNRTFFNRISKYNGG